MSRYNRHIILSEVGQIGQAQISSARVLVVGAGGLGCPVLQYLTAAGVGTIGIIDYDTVEESNLQRQVLFGTSSIGENKALSAKSKLEELNPTISIIAFPEMLTPKNAISLFTDFDIIVDGTDNFETRYLINDAAITVKKPVVYGAIYKFEGQVSVFNFNNGPSYRCLFPDPPTKGSVPNCSEIGVLGVLPGIIGAMQANEVLKIILNFEGVLSGKLLCYNAKTASTQILKVSRNEEEVTKVLTKNGQFNMSEFSTWCSSDIEISVAQLSDLYPVWFVDVREDHEQPKTTLEKLLHIPLGQLESRINEIPKNENVIVFCQSGIRSKSAVNTLRNHQYNKSYSLKEGALALLDQYLET